MSAQSVVLLSAGLDSTVNLYCALRDTKVLLALSFDYGQKAVKKELELSAKLCEKLGVEHKILDIKWLSEISQSSLTSSEEKIPTDKDVDINSYDQSVKSAKSVWVNNRNGVFLNIAACFAENLKADFVVPGFNKEEAQTFPDNSVNFIKALDHSFSFSTSNQVKVKCYTAEIEKKEIYKWGQEMNVDFDLVWPCYKAGDELCGECESCQRYKAAKA